MLVVLSVFRCLHRLQLSDVGAAPFAVAVGAEAVAMFCSLSMLALLVVVSAQWLIRSWSRSSATMLKLTTYLFSQSLQLGLVDRPKGSIKDQYIMCRDTSSTAFLTSHSLQSAAVTCVEDLELSSARESSIRRLHKSLFLSDCVCLKEMH